eukprot:6197925-Prorocentrum_lima.AAC.1
MLHVEHKYRGPRLDDCLRRVNLLRRVGLPVHVHHLCLACQHTSYNCSASACATTRSSEEVETRV